MKTVTITKGSVRVPCHSCGSVTSVNVKQTKGQGTYDAIRLEGKLPKRNHLQIIGCCMRRRNLTTEQIRYFVNGKRRYPIAQSHFQRFHSELLFWKIIVKADEKINPPVYFVNYSKAIALLEGGTFC